MLTLFASRPTRLTAGLVAATLLVSVPAFGQGAGKVGPKVGTPLKAALEASAKGQTPQAVAKLKEADSVSGKTAFEQAKINEAYCSVYVRGRNWAAAGPACEKSMGNPPTGQQLQTLSQIYFQPGGGRNLKKSIDYADRYLKSTGGRDANAHFLIGQAQHAGGNYKAAIGSFNTAIRARGGRPEENWLRYLQDSYTKTGDTAGASRVTTDLVRYYPNADNWRLLTGNLRRQVGGNEQAELNVYLLMYELNVLSRAEDYTEAAIVAIQAGIPGEAVRILDRGRTTQALAAGDQARLARITSDATKRAADQKAGLPRADQQAAAGKDPAADVRVGEAWLSYGEADKAIAAAKRALGKPGVDVDQANLLLGRAYVAKKNGAEARKAFAAVKSPSYQQIAQLWSIRAGQV
jgi:tetratricopeptide (TPR) repeat protein